jgi:lipoprotein-anchoring transpeptidase ErfK/SrfK
MSSVPSLLALLAFATSLAIPAGAVQAADNKPNKRINGEAIINYDILTRKKPETSPVINIFLQEQEMVFTLDGEKAIISPVSTGRKKGWTPLGEFSIIGKSANHRSSAYGKHVNKAGKTIRSNVDSRKTTPPPGGRFVGSPMPNFLRMTPNGIGIHAGELPGYPASHGCIRVPKDVSRLLFEHCPVGTKVVVWESRGLDNGKT